MKHLREFLHQKAPEAGTETPPYYYNTLSANQKILAVYFLVSTILISLNNQQFAVIPAVFFAVTCLCIYSAKDMTMYWLLGTYTVTTFLYTGWFVYAFGWACGGQHLLLPLLLLNFFNIFIQPWLKIVNTLLLFLFRMLLFAFAMNNVPIYLLSSNMNIIFQLMNSTALFLMLSLDCIYLSNNVQETERELRINNQELSKEAETDPLTQLPNRRSMLDLISVFRLSFPETPFSVAIGDIDHFKNINDTYGHNCGDFTLTELSKLLREKAAANEYSVCRWGGEEFCFFLPGKNVDEAWNAMFDVCESVRKMPLNFEGTEFSITITIGIEENDYRSSLEQIMDKADKKLYMGKVAGRNRVVM